MQLERLDSSLNLYQTNVVANVLYWNVIGCIFSLFMFLFDGAIHVNNTASGVSIMGLTEFSETAIVVTFVVSVALSSWCVGLTYAFINPLIASALLFIPLGFAAFTFFLALSEKTNIKKKNPPYPARKRLVFWVGYTLAVPFVAQCIDMLLQRRDYLLNTAMFIAVVVVGLCSLAIEMLQTTFEHSRRNDDKSNPGVGYHVELQIFLLRKNRMIRIIMLCTGVLVVVAFFSTFPVFPSTPFSNAYVTAALVAFILTLPLISSARHLSEVRSWFVSCLCTHLCMPNLFVKTVSCLCTRAAVHLMMCLSKTVSCLCTRPAVHLMMCLSKLYLAFVHAFTCLTCFPNCLAAPST